MVVLAKDAIYVFEGLGGETDINNNSVSTNYNFQLQQNYPNSFNPVTMIKYNIYKPGNVIFKIYNLSGQELETLVNGFQTAGEYVIPWQPKGLPSGIYFYRLQSCEFSETKKLVLKK